MHHFNHIRMIVAVRGQVRDVGFRAGTRDRALALGLKGWVADAPEGTIEAVIEGPPAEIDQLLAWMRQGPPGARVQEIRASEKSPEHAFGTFSIGRSIRQAHRLALDCPAALTLPGSSDFHSPAWVLDVSANGVQVVTAAGTCARGDDLMLSLVTPSGRSFKRIAGRVVRVSEPAPHELSPRFSPPVPDHELGKIGIAFVSPPQSLVDEITELVNLDLDQAFLAMLPAAAGALEKTTPQSRPGRGPDPFEGLF